MMLCLGSIVEPAGSKTTLYGRENNRNAENSIVASGSVVNKDVPPYTIVGGSPAKFIKEIVNN